MTFFLPATEADPAVPSALPTNFAPRPPASWGETFSASWRQEQIRQNAWDYSGRVQRQLLEEIYAGLPEKPFARPLVEEWQRTGDWRPIRAKVLEAARAQAALEPGAWGALPLEEEAFQREALRRRKAELEDAQATLAMGSGAGAEFAGAAARASTDVTSLALMPLGTGGGLARVFAGESALGVLGEAMALPAQFSTAEELDQPDPDVATQLAVGGVGSGVIAGGAVALGRGAGYLATRRDGLRRGRPELAGPAEHQLREDAATQALREGQPIASPPPVPDERLERTARKIIGVESGGRARAQNPNSTAYGPGQFIEETWLGMLERHRPDLVMKHGRGELLAMRADPDLAMEMTVALARENRDALQGRGFDGSEPDLYLAHFLGADGAVRALGAPPDAPITAVMSEAQLAANSPRRKADGSWTGGVKFDGRPIRAWTVRDLRRWSEYKMGLAADPGGGYAAASRAGYTAPDQVVTPQGTRIGVDYEVVDLDDLIFAAGGRQNRDRSRPAPTANVIRRASQLDPALLMPSPMAGHGAPIVGPDNVIDSGNGRVMSILYAARNVPDRYAAYVDAIRRQFEIPDGVGSPVLIARRGDMEAPDLERFVREANSDAVERLSASEQARTDAAGLTPEILGLYDPTGGDPFSAGNRAFSRALLRALPAAEQGQLVTDGGGLAAVGRERLRSALFARAYDAPDLTAAQAELGGGDVRSIVEALTDAAPAWAQLRQAVEAGVIDPAYDVTTDLLDAIRVVQEARRVAAEQGVSVRGAIDDILAQGDIFGGGPTPATFRAVGILYRGGQARGRDAIARSLVDYASEARALGGADNLLAAEGRGPLDVLDALAARLEREAPAGRVDAPQSEGGVQRAPDALPEADMPRLIEIDGIDDAAWHDGAEASTAKLADDQAEATLRAAVEAGDAADARARSTESAELLSDGDFEIEIDGRQGRASEILQELDDDAEFADAIQFCAAGGRFNA